MNKVCLFVFFIALGKVAHTQENKDTLPLSRNKALAVNGSILGIGVLGTAALSSIWYDDFEKSKFHFLTTLETGWEWTKRGTFTLLHI